jgi:titin
MPHLTRARVTRLRLEALERRTLPSTFTVLNTNDSGPGSLRQALLDANVQGGLDTIAFGIGSGVKTIAPNSPLPAVTDPVVIDGTTQPGSGSTLRIVLSGSKIPTATGLDVTAGGSTVRGLVVDGFTSGVGLWLESAGGNTVVGDFIGTNAAGTAKVPNATGVRIDSANNTVGGLTAGAGDLISGNGVGVLLTGGGSSGNLVQGCRIGTNAAGTAAVANGTGVRFENGALLDTLGGTVAAALNLVSGNTLVGVSIDGPTTQQDSVWGNRIGTDALGGTAIPNGTGVEITNGATLNTVGGNSAEFGNVISGNTGSGVHLSGNGVRGNFIRANRVGTNAAGTAKVPNGIGVALDAGATVNAIGGDAPPLGNLISGNSQYGLYLTGGATGDRVQNNFIGTDVTGTLALGNGLDGIFIQNALNLTIGGTLGGTVSTGNLVSGNGGSGVHISGAGATNNRVQGNRIGTSAAGTAAVPNRAGLTIDMGSQGNTIGGTTAATRNTISGNQFVGVALVGTDTANNIIQGNYIGTTSAGTAKLPNGTGITLLSGARNNTIGGTTASRRNVISGNSFGGLSLGGTGTAANVALGNFIGTDASGTVNLGNGGPGVAALSGASGNTVGGTTAGAGNFIAFNSGDGVLVDASTGVAIRGNAISANGGLGIRLADGGNANQPAPVLTSATAGGGTVTVTGTLAAAPTTTYALDFFANTVCDPSGFGEGERYLGSAAETTNATGTVAFTVTLNGSVPAGQFMTATATDPAGNTSQFSACQVVTAGAAPSGGMRPTLSAGTPTGTAALLGTASRLTAASGRSYESAGAGARSAPGPVPRQQARLSAGPARSVGQSRVQPSRLPVRAAPAPRALLAPGPEDGNDNS